MLIFNNRNTATEMQQIEVPVCLNQTSKAKFNYQIACSQAHSVTFTLDDQRDQYHLIYPTNIIH